MRRALARERAKKAHDRVKKLLKTGGNPKEFRSRVKRLPGLIRRSGLLGVAVYGYAKKERSMAISPVFEWLREMKYLQASHDDPDALIEELIRMDAHSLMLATQEALAFADWLAKMASALIPEKDGNTK